MHVLLNVSDKKKVAKNPQYIYQDSKLLATGPIKVNQKMPLFGLEILKPGKLNISLG